MGTFPGSRLFAESRTAVTDNLAGWFVGIPQPASHPAPETGAPMAVDTLDVVEYLTGKGVQLFRAAGPEVTAHCFFCPDGDTKGKGKLYINTETWLWDCKRCGTQGNRKVMLRHFGDEDGAAVIGLDPGLRMRILYEAVDAAHEMLIANDEVLQILFNRGINADTIMERRYGYVPRNYGLTRALSTDVTKKDLIQLGLLTVRGDEFFNHSLVIPYWSHGHVVQIREKQLREGGHYRTMGGDKARLYNADSLQAAADVIVVEGEFDADILSQTLFAANDATLRRTAVVGLPGAGSWPDNFESYFSEVTRVFGGFDPDNAGHTYSQKLRRLIGPGKYRLIELPKQLPKCDWTEYLRDKTPEHPHGGHTWRDVQSLMVQADLDGKRMFTLPEARAKWGQQKVEQPGLRLGFASLDSVIKPGVKPGQIFIPVAKTGTGKSVWLSNVAHNMRSRRVLYVSLELTATEIFEHFRRIHHFWFPEASQDQADEDYARMRVVDQNRLKQGDLNNLIAEYAEQVGDAPEVVIVDYLQYLARGFRGGSSYERTSEATMELKAVGKETGVAMIVPSQVNRGAKDGQPIDSDDARDSGVVEETADFMLSLFRPDNAIARSDEAKNDTLPPPTGAFSMQLLKSRHGGKGRLFNARLSNLSLVIADAMFDRKAIHLIDQENSLYRQGIHYEDYRSQQAPTLTALQGGA